MSAFDMSRFRLLLDFDIDPTHEWSMVPFMSISTSTLGHMDQNLYVLLLSLLFGSDLSFSPDRLQLLTFEGSGITLFFEGGWDCCGRIDSPDQLIEVQDQVIEVEDRHIASSFHSPLGTWFDGMSGLEWWGGVLFTFSERQRPPIPSP